MYHTKSIIIGIAGAYFCSHFIAFYFCSGCRCRRHRRRRRRRQRRRKRNAPLFQRHFEDRPERSEGLKVKPPWVETSLNFFKL